MIRKTLKPAQAATFSIDLPDPNVNGMPSPTGTGFFISPDGWFVTAAHVVTQNGLPDGPVRADIHQAWLRKEVRLGTLPSGVFQGIALEFVDPSTDFALLKVDFASNAKADFLTGKTGFPHIEISERELDEGEPVYAFGYPLSMSIPSLSPGMIVVHTTHSPRVTSAIVASTMEHTPFIAKSSDAKVYVLDKALNYGNSGGPILATETGKVHALCSRFQPVQVPQPHISAGVWIEIPSLYGIVSSLSQKQIIHQLKTRGVAVSNL